jgi:putative NADH-flavin reductase
MGGFDETLVTGASGFVGSAIAKVFRESGHQVRALVRASSPTININPADVVVLGDICDRNAVAAAVRGVRYVVHAAADYRLWAPFPAEVFRTNVEGTRIVMEEALRSGVERIVYTSSAATIDLRAGVPADESRPLAEDRAIGVYKKSKVIAERMVEDMAKNAGLPVVIVNPYRAHHRRGGAGAYARVCRYRAQSRACRRCGSGASCSAAQGHDRRTLHSRGRECAFAYHAGGNRANRRAAASLDSASLRGCLSVCRRR